MYINPVSSLSEDERKRMLLAAAPTPPATGPLPQATARVDLPAAPAPPPEPDSRAISIGSTEPMAAPPQIAPMATTVPEEGLARSMPVGAAAPYADAERYAMTTPMTNPVRPLAQRPLGAGSAWDANVKKNPDYAAPQAVGLEAAPDVQQPLALDPYGDHLAEDVQGARVPDSYKGEIAAEAADPRSAATPELLAKMTHEEKKTPGWQRALEMIGAWGRGGIYGLSQEIRNPMAKRQLDADRATTAGEIRTGRGEARQRHLDDLAEDSLLTRLETDRIKALRPQNGTQKYSGSGVGPDGRKQYFNVGPDGKPEWTGVYVNEPKAAKPKVPDKFEGSGVRPGGSRKEYFHQDEKGNVKWSGVYVGEEKAGKGVEGVPEVGDEDSYYKATTGLDRKTATSQLEQKNIRLENIRTYLQSSEISDEQRTALKDEAAILKQQVDDLRSGTTKADSEYRSDKAAAAKAQGKQRPVAAAPRVAPPTQEGRKALKSFNDPEAAAAAVASGDFASEDAWRNASTARKKAWFDSYFN